jgi:hypothetical protein
MGGAQFFDDDADDIHDDDDGANNFLLNERLNYLDGCLFFRYRVGLLQGCQIFLGKKHRNGKYQMTTKNTKFAI